LDLSIADISLSNQNKPDFEEKFVERWQEDESLEFENKTAPKQTGKSKTLETEIRVKRNPLTTPKRGSVSVGNEVGHSVVLPNPVKGRMAFSLFRLRNSSDRELRRSLVMCL
jgi:hypothetical protein